MLSEKQIESQIVTAASGCGWLAYKLQSPTSRGIPDRILIRNGVVVFMEIKTPRGRLSLPQSLAIRKLRRYGANVVVVKSVSAAIDYLMQFDK